MTQVVLTFEPIQPCSKVLTVEGLTTMDISISFVLGFSTEKKILNRFHCNTHRLHVSVEGRVLLLDFTRVEAYISP